MSLESSRTLYLSITIIITLLFLLPASAQNYNITLDSTGIEWVRLNFSKNHAPVIITTGNFSGTDYLRHDGDTAEGNYTFDTNTFHIDSTSNRVGILTTTPEQPFHVAGHAIVYDLYVNQEVLRYGDPNTGFYFYPDDRLVGQAGGEVILDLFEGVQDYVKLGDGGDVDINLNDDMFIRGSDSRVGINTITPNNMFEVHLDTNENIGFRDNSRPTIECINDARSAFVPCSINANPLLLGAGIGGLVGIGTVTSPAERLEVEDNLADTTIQISNTAVDGDPQLAFALSGTKTITCGVDDTDDSFKCGTTSVNTDTWLDHDPSNDQILLSSDGVENDIICITQGCYHAEREVTIEADGTLALTSNTQSVDTFADAASDNLDTIDTIANGFDVIIRAENGGRTVNVRDNGVSGGNIYLDGNTAFSMTDKADALHLRQMNGQWHEVSRSNN